MTIKNIIDKERWGFIRFTRFFRVSYLSVNEEEHNASLDRIQAAVDERIAELEAQIPKTATPITESNFWECPECGQELIGDDNYCPECGSKLNWEEK